MIQLIQRFYDTDGGSIVVDGNNVKDLNVRWLREHIGVVSQEPVLFATTIAENIKFGRADVSQAEMDQACIDAKAYDFIQKLPKVTNADTPNNGEFLFLFAMNDKRHFIEDTVLSHLL